MSTVTQNHYQSVRIRQITYAYNRKIASFLNQYVSGRPTVILLPGGMGSQLYISNKKYKKSAKFSNSKYSVIWMDAGLLFDEDLNRLQLKRVGNDYEDYMQYCVIPDGELRLLYKPYDATKSFFANQGYNFLTFGYDWRRSLLEGVSFFELFLKQLKEQSLMLKNENPLPGLILIGHSLGGSILHLWLIRKFYKINEVADANEFFQHLITVGTPFYGTTTHIQRYFDGEDLFNFFYGRENACKLISSLPGPYILMPLDKKIYNQFSASLNLDRYPLRDENDEDLDPYAAENSKFFPKWISKEALKEAAELRNTLRLPINEKIIPKIYNLLATGNKKTIVDFKWDKNKEAGEKPISGRFGRGDGTVPEWSGRLAEVPNDNVVKFEKLTNHTTLMEHTEVLNTILHIIRTSAIPKQIPYTDHIPIVEACTKDELDLYLNDIKKRQIKRNENHATDPRIWKHIVEEICK